MTNYLLNLPDEIFDIILLKCTDHYNDHDNTSLFIRYEYIFSNPIKRIYYEYNGTMHNGKPNGFGTMYCGSAFLTSTAVQDNITNPTHQPIATDWLYLPFLYKFEASNAKN